MQFRSLERDAEALSSYSTESQANIAEMPEAVSERAEGMRATGVSSGCEDRSIVCGCVL